MFTIVGLGNPGKEYENTRHNMGRIVLEHFADKNGFSEWRSSKKVKALYSWGKIGKNKVELFMPETFMNNSGKAVLFAKTKHKVKPENIIVIYDDIDLPFGTFKVAWDRGSGGHKGVDSIIKSLKTKKFVRIRVGICPITPTGKLRKPKGEQKVLDFIMKNFNKKEVDVIKEISRKIDEALEVVIKEGRVSAMNKFN